MAKNIEDIFGVDDLSKTKRKAYMEYLQDIGLELAKLSEEQLSKFELPERLLLAIRETKKITANGAIRRQRQYLGKLMRSVEIEPIIQKLGELKTDAITSTRILHECERWRDNMLDSDDQLTTFIHIYPKCDINELRSLVRVIRKKKTHINHKYYNKLFKLIHKTIEGMSNE